MLSSASCLLRHSQRRPLAACMAAMFAVTAPLSCAASTWIVNVCDEGTSGNVSTKTGTLRFAVANATSGDTVDMSGLGCSTITLTTGAITIAQQILTLHGPGKHHLAITGKNGSSIEPDRIINHTYGPPATTGHLYIDNLSMGYGQFTSAVGGAHGGCIRSPGSVTLTNVGVYFCTATTSAATMASALGGGVYAHSGLTIKDKSNLLHNTVSAINSGIRSEGGGAYTQGPFDMSDSSVAYNQALGPSKTHGGGLGLRGNATITGSVIGANYSSGIAGGILIFNATPAGVTTTISNSTITTNNAKTYVGGLYANSGTVSINNSTIVLNKAAIYTYTLPPITTTYFAAPGVSVSGYFGPVALSMQSTIIANNTSGSTSEDLSAGAKPANVTITGSNNLVRTHLADVTLPSGQGNLTGVCPLLGPIRDNGGLTFTHALLSGSPAIDNGNNTANDPHTGVPAVYDERGSPYARVSGSSADIGAYEVQKGDIVFNAGLDGCP
jgi:hypothetical protein